jgi:CBS domain-containing protein
MALLIYDNGNLVRSPSDAKFARNEVTPTGSSQGSSASANRNTQESASQLSTMTYSPRPQSNTVSTRSSAFSSRMYEENSRKTDTLQDRRKLSAVHVMTSPVITISQFDTVKNALQIMHHENIDHLVVVNSNGHPLGVITDGQLLRHGAESNSFVENLLERSLIAVSPDTLVRDIALVFMEEKVSCVPVINQAHQVAGIICRSDLLRLLVSGPNMAQRA